MEMRNLKACVKSGWLLNVVPRGLWPDAEWGGGFPTGAPHPHPCLSGSRLDINEAATCPWQGLAPSQGQARTQSEGFPGEATSLVRC